MWQPNYPLIWWHCSLRPSQAVPFHKIQSLSSSALAPVPSFVSEFCLDDALCLPTTCEVFPILGKTMILDGIETPKNHDDNRRNDHNSEHDQWWFLTMNNEVVLKHVADTLLTLISFICLTSPISRSPATQSFQMIIIILKGDSICVKGANL